jgi:hypothetical protein
VSPRLSLDECRRVFELLGYYPDFEDPNVYLNTGTRRGPKAFTAFAEALENVDPNALIRWMVEFQGMSPVDVGQAVEAVLNERP